MPERGRKRQTFSLVGWPIFTWQESPQQSSAVTWTQVAFLKSRVPAQGVRRVGQRWGGGQMREGPPARRPPSGQGQPPPPAPGWTALLPQEPARLRTSCSFRQGCKRRRKKPFPKAGWSGQPPLYHLRRPFLVTLLLLSRAWLPLGLEFQDVSLFNTCSPSTRANTNGKLCTDSRCVRLGISWPH